MSGGELVDIIPMQSPVIVLSTKRIHTTSNNIYFHCLDTNTERESGRKAQLSNIEATKVKQII